MTILLPVKEASIYGIMRKKISKETGNLNNTTEQRHLAGIMYRTFYQQQKNIYSSHIHTEHPPE